MSSLEATVERLTRLINGEAVTPKELDEVLVGHPLEDWARLEAERIGVDLSLVLPMALTLVSACSNGAIRAAMPDFTSPITSQYIGLARSGVRKSTVLDSGRSLLDDALDAGEDAIGAWVDAQLAAIGDPPVGVPWTRAHMEAMYDAGRCYGGSVLSSATQEAVRNSLAQNGSHLVIWTGESDFFEEVSRYQKDEGSMSMLLHGWDAGHVEVGRVSGTIRARHASLPITLFTHSETFDKITESGSFMTKGVLHRMLITTGGRRTEIVGERDGLAALSSPLAAARLAFGANLTTLAVDTAPYRAFRAADAWWRTEGRKVGLPMPTAVELRKMRLADDDALDFYWDVVQEIRKAVEAAAADPKMNPGAMSIWEALAARFTSHVLRIACGFRLGVDPLSVVVYRVDLEDAVFRVLPWFWEHWALAVQQREVTVLETAVQKSMKDNPRGLDNSLDGQVLRAFAVLVRKRGIGGPLAGPGPAHTKSEIVKQAQDLLNGPAKRGAYGKLRETLERMVTEGVYVEYADGESYNGRQKVRLSAVGVPVAMLQVR